MKLPENAIGISDIQKHRECARKMGYQMRRWTEGEQPPEDQHPDTMYGTVFHDTVEITEEKDLSDDEALQFAFNRYARYLAPEDLEKLKLDLQTYRERDEVGVRTLANEKEVRVPLLEWCYDCGQRSIGAVCEFCGQETATIYFRARIDRLYQRLDNEAVFLHRDYKSSKWPKSEEEVHKDPQMWSYNWIIHEYWPECESLTQIYDQLRYGEIPTRKSDEQREEIREWLVRQVISILEAEEPVEPTFNQWCPWCPIKQDCPVIDRLTDFEVARIKALLPADEEPDTDLLEVYVEKLGDVDTAIKTLEAYRDRVKGVVRELPDERKDALGFKLSPRSFDVWSPAALEAAHDILGEDFYNLVKLSKRQVNDFLADDDRQELVLGLARKKSGTPQLRSQT